MRTSPTTFSRSISSSDGSSINGSRLPASRYRRQLSASHPFRASSLQQRAARPLPKGGSMNTMSMRVRAADLSSQPSASACSTRPATCHSSTTRRSIPAAERPDSTNTQSAAPRDSASRPSAPAPANRSRQCAPRTSGASQSNRVSRARTGVGRAVGGTFIRRPRKLPPAIRTWPGCLLAGMAREYHFARTPAVEAKAPAGQTAGP